MEYFSLRNGAKIPAIGFGPDSLSSIRNGKIDRSTILHKVQNRINRVCFDQPKYIRAIASSLDAGIRLLDYSASYGDGTLLAKGIRKANIARKDVIITTRISNRAQYNHTVEEELLQQLKGFQTDYVDILMFHWPVTDHFEDTWKEMLSFRKKGYCRILGVANCHAHHLERLYEVSGEYPEINQVEIHPLFTQEPLRKYCRDHDILMEAYTPTARQDKRLTDSRFIKEIAAAKKKSVTQIILRWHYQNNVIPIIRSMNPDHIRSNAMIFDFELSAEEMRTIDKMNIHSRLRYDPDNCDFSSL